MDVIIPISLAWDDDLTPKLIEGADRQRILLNITAAIQWIGFSVGFLYEGKQNTNDDR
jgi:hypothetical protein